MNFCGNTFHSDTYVATVIADILAKWIIVKWTLPPFNGIEHDLIKKCIFGTNKITDELFSNL